MFQKDRNDLKGFDEINGIEGAEELEHIMKRGVGRKIEVDASWRQSYRACP